MRAFIASIPNWHRYLVAFLLGLITLLLALQADPTLLPGTLAAIVPYERLAIVVIGIVLGGTPRWQLPTGPGAPPIVSPPPKDETVPHG